MNSAIFHLSLPVRDLQQTRDFYCSVLGAVPGRATPGWIDLIVFGHQLTFHLRPEEVRARDEQGVQHFGAILPWDTWEAVCEGVRRSGYPTLGGPCIFGEGTELEHGKLTLHDPNGYLLELKAYRDVTRVMPGIQTESEPR